MRRFGLTALALTLTTTTFAGDAPPLTSSLKYYFGKYEKTLEYVENEIRFEKYKNAKESIETMLADMEKRVGWSRGKVTMDHPEVVALQARATAILTKTAAAKAAKEGASTPGKKPAGGATPAPPPAKKAPGPAAAPPAAGKAAAPAGGGPLPSSFLYHFEKFPQRVEYAEQERARGRFKQALQMIDGVLADLEKRVEWSRGKVSPDHPEVVALRNRALAKKAEITASTAEAASASAALGPVVAAIVDLSPRVAKAVTAGRFAAGQVSRMEDWYSSNRNVERVVEVREASISKMAAAAAQVALAKETAAAFSAQFPDEDKLKALLPDKAYDAQSAVSNLTYLATEYERERDAAMTRLIDGAEGSVSSAESMLQAASPDQPAMLLGIESSVRMYAIDLYGRLMGVPARVLGADAPAAKKAAALETRILALEDRLATLKGEAADAKARKVKAARFPTKDVTDIGADKDAVVAAVAKEFTDGPIQRIAVTAPWETRTEARWVGNRWDVGTFKYLGIVHATATPSGKHRVYYTTVRRRKSDDGSWGPIRHYSVGSSYEILPENIGK